MPYMAQSTGTRSYSPVSLFFVPKQRARRPGSLLAYADVIASAGSHIPPRCCKGSHGAMSTQIHNLTICEFSVLSDEKETNMAQTRDRKCNPGRVMWVKATTARRYSRRVPTIERERNDSNRPENLGQHSFVSRGLVFSVQLHSTPPTWPARLTFGHKYVLLVRIDGHTSDRSSKSKCAP